jgi:hypothetical protein
MRLSRAEILMTNVLNITRRHTLAIGAATSGPAGCIQRPDTWLHPNVSRKGQILFPCTAGAVHRWQVHQG